MLRPTSIDKNPNVRLTYHNVYDASLNDFVNQKSDADGARAKPRQALHYPCDMLDVCAQWKDMI